MASYQDDERQTLGDIVARMKPLPYSPGADDDAQARTQQHNDALAQLQSNALVARHLAQNTIINRVPFPESLMHFVPGRMVGPLAAVRAGGNTNSWPVQPSVNSPDDARDPWSYASPVLAANGQNSSSAMPPTAGNSAWLAPTPFPPGVEGASPASGALPGIRQPPAAMLKGPVFPPIPPGADIADNMNAAKAHHYYPDALKYLWFYNQVHNRAPWDYKQVDKEKYAPFGNFNYGATGAMLNIPLDALLRMAGSAQVRDGNSSPAFGRNPGRPLSLFGVGGVAPYGDDPVDQTFIKKGFQFAQPFVPPPPVALTDDDGVPLYR